MNPLVLIDRLDRQPKATRSHISVAGVRRPYVALEDIVRKKTEKKVPGETAIDAGIYPLDMRPSAHFSKSFLTIDDINLISLEDWFKLPKARQAFYHPHDVIHVDNVPNFAEILHHWGNFIRDTRGCTLIGTAFALIDKEPAISASKAAYVKYYAEVAALIRTGGQTVEYRNSFAITT